MAAHLQFHRPKGLPFACPRCSFNVTRRSLLQQHVKVHGLSPSVVDQLYSNDCGDGISRPPSPSPSLTIIPLNKQGGNGAAPVPIAPAPAPAPVAPVSGLDLLKFIPLMEEGATTGLPDIPLVWCSRDSKLFKVYKCRWCPHVNMRKPNVQDHEKMHANTHDTSLPADALKCPYCTFVTVNV